MRPLDYLVLMRAEEQVQAVKTLHVRERRHDDVPNAKEPPKLPERPCLAGDCKEPRYGGCPYCVTHRGRWLRTGDVEGLFIIPWVKGVARWKGERLIPHRKAKP